ncbi:hypothetical protein ACFYVL_12015 [Streptomyces sp. NPDC004111]|uniref:hypothetical protein n=1 Tax=Streptomyces sp. NPDC004111 TaxID=3364690 RepID=UPI0036B702F7
MAGLFSSRPDTPLVPLSDREVFVEALRAALASTDDTERPGLERALAIVEATASPDPAVLRGRWALERIEAAGFGSDPQSVSAVKALREAEPSLSLRQAVALSKEAVAVSAR